MTCLLKLNCNYAIGYVMLYMYYLAAVESKSICLLAMNICMLNERKGSNDVDQANVFKSTVELTEPTRNISWSIIKIKDDWKKTRIFNVDVYSRTINSKSQSDRN